MKPRAIPLDAKSGDELRCGAARARAVSVNESDMILDDGKQYPRTSPFWNTHPQDVPGGEVSHT